MTYQLFANQLDPGQYQPYFQTYIDLVQENDVREQLNVQKKQLTDVFENVSEETASTVHPPYGWTLKQVVGHLVDGEKIFGCRAHRIACAENIPLPGFDQDLFVRNTCYDDVKISDLVTEFNFNRSANEKMLDRWTETMWDQVGVCDGKKISVRAIACLMVGHVNHHLSIIKKRLENH